MTTEERREYERKRWRRRYADPEFRKREAERSKKRMAEWLSDDKTRERYNARRRKYYQENREKVREYQHEYYQENCERIKEYNRNLYRRKKAQEEE